jgi:ribulose-5-phosphate 4-epimerase/fuculose-1-phosphate aldolase
MYGRRLLGLWMNRLNGGAPMTTMIKPAERSVRAECSAEEWALRVDLAACYRVFDYLGWTEMIFNHITMRVPGPEHHFLINPFGLHYSEVTASNLVKIDLDGKIVGHSDYPVNPAGFVIHSAIHAAVPDARCIMHTHTTAGMAVASSKRGLVPTNFFSAAIIDNVAYHDFEGPSVHDDEKPRLVASLGNKRALILRNHGLLVHGPTIPEAFRYHYQLQRACEVQLATSAIDDGIEISRAVIDGFRSTRENEKSGLTMQSELVPAAQRVRMLFDAMVRLVDKKDTSYRN